MRKQQIVKMKEVTAVLIVADQADRNGIVYPAETLRRVAETDPRLSFKDGKLVYTGPTLVPVNAPIVDRIVVATFSSHEEEQEEQCQSKE